jgi:hypothetical protein
MVEKGVGRICRKVGYRGEGEERMRGVRWKRKRCKEKKRM